MHSRFQLISTAIGCWVALSANALAAPSALDSTVISFSASGSPNTIAGSWQSGSLNAGISSAVDSFLVEFLGTQSTFGAPQSVTFVSSFAGNSVGLHFCSPVSVACVTDPTSGSALMVTQDNAPVDGAWTFLSRLLRQSPELTLAGNSGVSFSSGGGFATIDGQVRVTAYGEAVPVPEPITLFQMVAGLAVLTLAMKTKKHRLRAALPPVRTNGDD